MAKTIDADFAQRMRDESETTKDDPYPPDAHGSRPNRPQMYSVRLSR